MYPAIPYNASSIYGVIKMKWNKILSTVHYTMLVSSIHFVQLLYRQLVTSKRFLIVSAKYINHWTERILTTHCSTFYVLLLICAVFLCRRLRTKTSHSGSLCPQPVGPRRDHLWRTEAPSTAGHVPVPAIHIFRQKHSRAGNENVLNIGNSWLRYVISCSFVIL